MFPGRFLIVHGFGILRFLFINLQGHPTNHDRRPSNRGISQLKVTVGIAIALTTVFTVATRDLKNRDFADSARVKLAMMFACCNMG